MPTENIYDLYISFTYPEHAFKHRDISGIGGRLLLSGYLGWFFMHAPSGYTVPPCSEKNVPDQAIHHLMETE